MTTLLLLCSCGRRIKAPGATPGRLGRCPSCGALLRVPEPETDAATAPAEAPPPVVDDEDAPAFPRSKSRKKKRRRPVIAAPSAIVSGPTEPERSVRVSLKYPLWDAPGLVALVAYPPALTFASTIFAGVSFAAAHGRFERGPGGMMLIALVLLLPMLAVAAIVVGYVAQALGPFLVASAHGEVYHPHQRFADVHDMLRGLGRSLWAAVVGGLLGGLPAVAYATYCGPIDGLDLVVLAILLGPGLAFAQLALAAAFMFEDLRAAGPFTVLRAAVQIGPFLLVPAVASGAFALIVLLLLAALPAMPNALTMLGFGLVAWALTIYGLLVCFRLTGLSYYRCRHRVGWFREKPQWGVRGA